MITCSHCGQIAADGSAFCPNCGAALPAPYFQQPQQPVQQPVYPQPQMPPYPGYPTPCEQPGTNGKAVASLVMGICSLLVWLLFLTNDFDAFSFLSIPLGIISIVMGAVAKKEIRRTTPGQHCPRHSRHRLFHYLACAGCGVFCTGSDLCCDPWHGSGKILSILYTSRYETGPVTCFHKPNQFMEVFSYVDL